MEGNDTSGTSNTSSASNITTDECLEASEVVLSWHAKFARAILLAFNTAVFFLLALLIFTYWKKRLALHPNLRLLYANIIFIFLLSSLAYYAVELRNLFLASFVDPNAPCEFKCPLWYVVLSRGAIFFTNAATPFLHFAVMLERWRATRMAKNYEREGIRYGVISLMIVYLLSFVYIGILIYVFLLDNQMDLGKMLPYNSMVTPINNSIVIFHNSGSIVLIALTALGDWKLVSENRRLRRRLTEINNCSTGYSLSENYQLHENLIAMRYILPLDCVYTISTSLYCALTILLRFYQSKMSFTYFFAYYNLITCCSQLYMIISLVYYCRFLKNGGRNNWQQGETRRHRRAEVAPMEQIGNVHFEQLRAQWN